MQETAKKIHYTLFINTVSDLDLKCRMRTCHAVAYQPLIPFEVFKILILNSKFLFGCPFSHINIDLNLRDLRVIMLRGESVKQWNKPLMDGLDSPPSD